MLRIRRAAERGQFDHGWLKTAHTFSFADYHDPQNVQFRNLRVINEDVIAGGGGFPMHGHRDMEIITYVLSGGLEHRDNMGNRGVIYPGIVQRMSAGTGVMHSEFNSSESIPVHLYQIWIMPNARGVKPGYEERALPDIDQAGAWVTVASPDGEAGSATIHADAKLMAARLQAGGEIGYTFAPGRHGWLQVTRGAARANGEAVAAGDGVAISDLARLEIAASEDAELLLFDLA